MCPLPGCGKGLSAPVGKTHLYARKLHVRKEHPRAKWDHRFKVKYEDRKNNEARESKRLTTMRNAAAATRIKLLSMGLAKHHTGLDTFVRPLNPRRRHLMQICRTCGCTGKTIRDMHKQECEVLVDPPPGNTARLNTRKRVLQHMDKEMKKKIYSEADRAQAAELRSILAPKPRSEDDVSPNTSSTGSSKQPKRLEPEGLGGLGPKKRARGKK